MTGKCELIDRARGGGKRYIRRDAKVIVHIVMTSESLSQRIGARKLGPSPGRVRATRVNEGATCNDCRGLAFHNE